jgi:hypothetical protein
MVHANMKFKMRSTSKQDKVNAALEQNILAFKMRRTSKTD